MKETQDLTIIFCNLNTLHHLKMNKVFDIKSIRNHLINSLGFIGDIAKLLNDKMSQYNDYEEPFLLSIILIVNILKKDTIQAVKSKI